MQDCRVDAALAKLRPLPHAERLRLAAGPFEAQAALLLLTPPLALEAKMIMSVAHMRPEAAMVVLSGVAEERGKEATDRLLDQYSGPKALDPCGRLCVLVNQGPCGCRVPVAVAELRRRQRALLWACEALLRPEVKP